MYLAEFLRRIRSLRIPTRTSITPSPISPQSTLPSTIVGAMQLLAERGAEQAYRQALEGTMRQLAARGLAQSGISRGALFNLGQQFAQQLADIRAKTAATAAEMQLDILRRLLEATQARESLLFQLAAQKYKGAQEALAGAQSQFAALAQALAGAVGMGLLGNVFNLPTSTTPAPTSSLSTRTPYVFYTPREGWLI